MVARRVIPVLTLLLAFAVAADAGQRGGQRSASGGGRVAVARSAPASGVRVYAPSSRVYATRSYAYARPYGYARSYGGYVRPYGYARPYYAGHAYYAARPYYYGHAYYHGHPHYYYAHPYYAFVPTLSIGFGLWVGAPVPYPAYGYPVPYPYAAPYPYPYPAYQQPTYQQPAYPQTSTTVTPSAVGGLSFEISPSNAAIYIDGQYAGSVSDFGPSSPPLSVTPGRHHVELQADGYVPMGFDVDVVAGQVVPYRGDLRRN